VIGHWQAALGTDSYTVQEIISRATDTLPQQRTDFNSPKVQYHWPEFREALLGVAGKGGSVNGYKLGTWLSHNKGRLVNGLRIENGAMQQTWRVGKPI
jgi:putative DNA primase/helicase